MIAQAVHASWIKTVDPAVEPVSVAEAKQHARILYNTDDGVIARFIRTAREAAEDYLQRGLYTQTWQMSLAHFATIIPLPMAAPLQSVTSVQYYDGDGILQTLASSSYALDLTSRPASITRAANVEWPTLQSDRRAPRVLITYVVGWSSAAAIPERIKQGIRTYVAYLNCDREGLEEDASKALASAQACWADRVEWIEPTHWSWWTDACR